MSTLEERAARYRDLVQAEMRAVIGDERGGLFAWMRYHLGWEDAEGVPAEARRGKMLRPVGVLLAAEACGGPPEQAVPAAAAVELIHNFSLLHDDVEDASERRHDRPTLWTFAGAAQAINTGDGMYTLGRLAQHRMLDAGVPAERVLAAMRELDEACVRLVRGQYLDIDFERRRRVSREDYLEMAGGKTAAMFSAPLAAGAIVAGAPEATVDALRRFGYHVGIAFQAVDDLLGVWGDPAVTGKPVGDDLASRKQAYPVIAALEEGGETAAALAERFDRPPGPDEDLQAMARLIERAGGRDATEALAREHEQQAMAALAAAGLPAAEAECFEQYARAAVGRDF